MKTEILENIRRLEVLLQYKYWSEGYIKNCQQQLEFYKEELKKYS